MSIRSDILARMSHLPRPAQRIGRVLLSEPATVVGLGVEEVARLCDTERGAVIRFCHAVGFSGYGDLREALHEELGATARRGSHAGQG